MMAKKKRSGGKTRAEPAKKAASFLCAPASYEILCGAGYTKLSQTPEIIAAVNKIADLISGMTIHLMGNTDNGDTRIRNELAKKIDISPNRFTTRKTFLAAVVRTLLLEGDGNAVVLPKTERGYLEDLTPVPAEAFSFVPDGDGYQVVVNGKMYSPADVLHFVLNPSPREYWRGTGCRATLKETAENLRQANATKKGFMDSKWKPSMIVKVDGMVEEFASKEGRSRLLEQYVESTRAGEPWMLPAEQFEVIEVRPLSLNDIAIADSVRMDRRAVAAVLDVPPFVVGEGEYSEAEWNNFVNTRIRPICKAIEQELTKKLLLSPDWYFRFSIRSLYSYDIRTLSEVGANLYTRGIMTGNEVRDWMGLSPKAGLDELVILENYIPQGMIGEQKKLEK